MTYTVAKPVGGGSIPRTVVHPTSMPGDARLLIPDATIAVPETAQQWNPLLLAATEAAAGYAIWDIRNGTRMELFGKAELAAAISTMPVVKVWGVIGDPTRDANGVVTAWPTPDLMRRLDSSNGVDADAGLTIQFDQSTPSTTNALNDGTKAISKPAPAGGLDCRGFHWAVVLLATAAVSAGTFEIWGQTTN